MTEIDLFGEEYDPTADGPRHKGIFQRKKIDMHYQRSPYSDKKCANCGNRITKRHNRLYHKCEIVGDTASVATDIRLGYYCRLWEPAPEEKKKLW